MTPQEYYRYVQITGVTNTEEDMIGEIKLWGGATAPTDYAFCHGQLIPIASYPELSAILGDTFGGDGVNTSQLPDLRQRVVVGAGDASSGLGPAITLGQEDTVGATGSADVPRLGLNFIIKIQ